MHFFNMHSICFFQIFILGNKYMMIMLMMSKLYVEGFLNEVMSITVKKTKRFFKKLSESLKAKLKYVFVLPEIVLKSQSNKIERNYIFHSVTSHILLVLVEKFFKEKNTRLWEVERYKTSVSPIKNNLWILTQPV